MVECGTEIQSVVTAGVPERKRSDEIASSNTGCGGSPTTPAVGPRSNDNDNVVKAGTLSALSKVVSGAAPDTDSAVSSGRVKTFGAGGNIGGLMAVAGKCRERLWSEVWTERRLMRRFSVICVLLPAFGLFTFPPP